jgi:hypothetical protein
MGQIISLSAYRRSSRRKQLPEEVADVLRVRLTTLHEIERKNGIGEPFSCDLCLEKYSTEDKIIIEEYSSEDEDEFFSSYHYHCFADYLRSTK